MEDFSAVVSEVGRAYNWAQRLSGLEFLQGSGQGSLGPVASHEVGRAFVEQLVEAVRTRFSARVALHEQLLSLGKCSSNCRTCPFARLRQSCLVARYYS